LPTTETVELEILRECPGRAILASPDGALHLGRNYDILRSADEGSSWNPVSALPRSALRRLVEPSRLACRLLRQEVRALARLADDSYVASNREGVFHGRAGDREFVRCDVETGELPLMPPMRITVGPDDVVLWGEYGSYGRARPVRLYASMDRGRSFGVVHTLEAGSVLHIHNIVYDPGEEHYWVLSGDKDREPGIGKLSRDLQRFEWFRKGEQVYRAVEVFDFGDRLVYATDTHLDQNSLVSLDKASGRVDRLRDFDGSCIYACRFGEIFAITTTVEPSKVNRQRFASLWLSRDGERWKRALHLEKDRWNADYFQFGSIVLPSGQTPSEQIVFSGQALEELDGKTVVARLPDRSAL